MMSSPQNEAARLEVLDEYELIGQPNDPAVDEIVSLAVQLCGTTLGGIAFAGADAIYFQSRVGPGPVRLSRGRFPCEACMRGDGVYEISDARYHPDHRPDGIMVSGRAYRFFAGAPLVTFSGVSVGCLFVQDSVPHLLTDLQKRTLQVLARQVVAHFELNARTRSMDRDGRVRSRVESALTVERTFVSTVLDTVGALVAVFDTAGRIVRFNRTCELVSGYDFQAMSGRFLWEKLIPVEDIPEAVGNFERLRQGKFPVSYENFWQHRDGSLRRIAWSATGLVDAQGNTTFLIATGIDVTLQREAEATLRESEARYRQLVEGSLGMVCTHDLNGVLLSLNAHGAESTGHAVDQMLGHLLTDFMAHDRRAGFAQYLREILTTGESQGRLYILHPDGEERVIAFRNKLIEIPGHEPYVLGFGVDITEQVHAEEQLRALIHQSDSVLESVGDGIFGLDLEGRVTVINPVAAQMLGYRPQELLGRVMHGVIQHSRADASPYPADESPIQHARSGIDTVRVSSEVFWRKDGTYFPVDYVARPQIENGDGQGGHSVGVVVAFTDTTERRALDRMKDEFISTVSHELRTPLTSLRAALGLLAGGTLETRPERRQQMLEIATGNTDRLIRLINDILDIERIASGSEEMHGSVCFAQDLFERVTNLQAAAALKSRLRFAIDGGEVQIWADPDRILQALANLVSNAIKFSPPDGAITLQARYIDQHEAEFCISDEGRGIPESKLESVFERFHQVDASDSREMGGTGLGLAICRTIIQQQGGRIWASSPPGQGAHFHFTLPTQPSGHLR